MIDFYRQFLIIIVIAITATSCLESDDGYNSQILSTHALIDSHPDSALMILDSIDIAHHNNAEIHYLKGQAELNMLNYPAAFEEFLYAEKISEETGNDSILLLSRLGLRAVSDSVMDFGERTRYTLSICEIYERQHEYNKIIETLEDLLEGHNCFPPEYQKELTRYTSLLESSDTSATDSMLLIRYFLINPIKSTLSLNTTDISLCREIKSFNIGDYISQIKTHGDWQTAITNDSTVISYDAANMVVSTLWADGYQREARDFIRLYRKYYKEKKMKTDIDPITNRLKVHIESYDNTPVKGLFMKTFQNNLKSTATKFHYEEEVMRSEIIKSQRISLIMLSALTVAIIIAVILYVYIINIRRNRINDNNIRTATELRTALNTLEDIHLQTLSNLCNTYYDCYSNVTTKSKIAKEALLTINSIAESDDFIPKLESRLNESYDNLMTLFRNELDNLKESDYNLFTCNAIGLTIPAICLLLKEKRDVIYKRRLRLRAKIQDANPPHAAIFLEHLK